MSVPYRPPGYKAYIMSGIPGSGKSTFIKNNLPQAIVCSADFYHMVDGEYRFDPSRAREAHAWCMRRFVEACQDARNPVVCDNTNTTLAAIAPYMAVAQAYGYETEIIYFETTVADSIRRNVHQVPEETIRRMAGEHKRLMHDDIIPSWWKTVDWRSFKP